MTGPIFLDALSPLPILGGALLILLGACAGVVALSVLIAKAIGKSIRKGKDK